MKKIFINVLLACVSLPAVAYDRVSQLDKNGDGAVDLGELNLLCEVSEGIFNIADKNKDGVLSNREMRIAKSYLFKNCRKDKKD